MKPGALALVAIIALHGTLRAQTATLVGRAYTDTVPLPKALITVAGTSHVLYAGEDGRFRLVLPPGQHTVQVRAIGREPWSRVIELRAGESTYVLASLHASVTPLDPVSVTSPLSNLE